MPRVIESFNFTRARGEEKYPYDQWLDGQIWQLFPSEDFTTNPASFGATMSSAAKRRGRKCKVRVQDDGSVIIRAYHLDGLTPFNQPAPTAPVLPEANGQTNGQSTVEDGSQLATSTSGAEVAA